MTMEDDIDRLIDTKKPVEKELPEFHPTNIPSVKHIEPEPVVVKKNISNDANGPGLVSFAIVTVIMLVVGGIIVNIMWNAPYEYAIEKAAKDIDCCMNNVSDDYIQGWKDCIKRIDKYAHETTNVTANISKQMD